MIKVSGKHKINNLPDGTSEVECSLFADTKTEVKDDITGKDVDGLDNDDVIAFGSTAMTAAGEFAFRKSDGKWNWV